MILFVLTTFVLSAEDDTIYLEFGGKSKDCKTPFTACHSLDVAVESAKWDKVKDVVIQGHAELIGETVFDSSAAPFKKSPEEDLKYTITLSVHALISPILYQPIPGLTGNGTIVIKGSDKAKMHIIVATRGWDNFEISTSRTPGGVKKDYVIRVEEYGVLELQRKICVRPLELPTSTTTFTTLTSKVETTAWDQKSAAVVVEKGTLIAEENVIVYDPDLGVLILKDIDISNSRIRIHHSFSRSQTSLVPKGIVCSIPDTALATFNIIISSAGKNTMVADELVEIEQYPLDFHKSGKCAAYDYYDFTQKFPLNNTDLSKVKASDLFYPAVSLSRSDLKMPTVTDAFTSYTSSSGDNLLAKFTSEAHSLTVDALRRMKVSIAPSYHTKEIDDANQKWVQMQLYVGHVSTIRAYGGFEITQSGQSDYALAAVPIKSVGTSGEYTVKIEVDDEARYYGCLYSGARKTVAFASLALLLAVLLGF
ncbi:hypothetical protein BLNAU_7244 [Blattamonas nauphoetae]|uniref:Uncharacterized protein n=1 Tax=Blattamonas nauphoetae TaxID=2049346 RepID=A0ABQ9Y232_9EUKA|nr:hypothetical protein BLNAU_7244 [Blattamonas nauphoetae]